MFVGTPCHGLKQFYTFLISAKKIPMTVPVRMEHTAKKVDMAFMVPHHVKDDVPEPTASDVRVITVPRQLVYVRSVCSYELLRVVTDCFRCEMSLSVADLSYPAKGMHHCLNNHLCNVQARFHGKRHIKVTTTSIVRCAQFSDAACLQCKQAHVYLPFLTPATIILSAY